MTASQAIALAILGTQALCAYLLTQSDVVLPPIGKVIVGGLSVVLNVGALYLKVSLPGRDTTS